MAAIQVFSCLVGWERLGSLTPKSYVSFSSYFLCLQQFVFLYVYVTNYSGSYPQTVVDNKCKYYPFILSITYPYIEDLSKTQESRNLLVLGSYRKELKRKTEADLMHKECGNFCQIIKIQQNIGFNPL